uniref:Uncharacterized protein n=1 Tax=Picea glauca TaxID=3330 RepID=A0A124GMB6_PICGL|nr:hypothetical protein ABT39_MTgene3598 [Picea glauca]
MVYTYRSSPQEFNPVDFNDIHGRSRKKHCSQPLSPICVLSSHKIQFSTTLPILKIRSLASQFSRTTWKSPIVFT